MLIFLSDRFFFRLFLYPLPLGFASRRLRSMLLARPGCKQSGSPVRTSKAAFHISILSYPVLFSPFPTPRRLFFGSWWPPLLYFFLVSSSVNSTLKELLSVLPNPMMFPSRPFFRNVIMFFFERCNPFFCPPLMGLDGIFHRNLIPLVPAEHLFFEHHSL